MPGGRPADHRHVFKIRYYRSPGVSIVEYRSSEEAADKLARKKYEEGTLCYYGKFLLSEWYFDQDTKYNGMEETDEGQQG
jgi:hypothetical protein